MNTNYGHLTIIEHWLWTPIWHNYEHTGQKKFSFFRWERMFNTNRRNENLFHVLCVLDCISTRESLKLAARLFQIPHTRRENTPQKRFGFWCGSSLKRFRRAPMTHLLVVLYPSFLPIHQTTKMVSKFDCESITSKKVHFKKTR